MTTLGPTRHLPAQPSLTIRRATVDDDHALERLAQLDSARVPAAPVLVGEVTGELWTAVSLQDFQTISNPFRPSGELAFVVIQRARQLRRAQRRDRGRRLRLRPRRRASVA